MTRRARLLMLLATLFALGIDIYFYARRCEASPKIDQSALGFTLVVQALAVTLARWTEWELPVKIGRGFGRPALFGAALFLGTSVFLAQLALNYSDAIGQPRWFKSSGSRCSGA